MTPAGLGWRGQITYGVRGEDAGRVRTLLWCGWRHHAVEYALNLQTMPTIAWVHLHDNTGNRIEVSA